MEENLHVQLAIFWDQRITINEDEVELIPDKKEIKFPLDMHAAIEKF